MENITLSKRLLSLIQNEALFCDWEKSQKIMPEGRLFFLSQSFVEEACKIIGLETEAISYLQTVAEKISKDQDMARLAWHCHYLLFISENFDRGMSREFPYIEEFSGAFYLLIALSGVSKAMAFHRSKGIPEKIMMDTYTDTAIWARDYKDLHGVWGMNTHILPWIYNHVSGDLYRLVRLQFMQRPFRQKLIAFRNRETQKVIVLAESGVKYRADGEVDGAGGIFDPENGWTSQLVIRDGHIIGTPIHPKGIALKDEISLSIDVWECILKPGDPILEVHIPAGEKMDFEACGDSFRLAVNFFPKYFPDRPFKAFCCGSWLLNTQFQEMLGLDSNIVKFQKEFYLYPILSGGRSGIERIFRKGLTDLSTAPRDTRLRRAVLDHLQSGGYLRAGGGLIFPEDLNWGDQVYQI